MAFRILCTSRFTTAIVAAGLLGSPAASGAQKTGQRSTIGEAGHIASQPARDVGLVKSKVPPVLERVAAAPYAETGAASCAAIEASLSDLDDALGPDYGHSATPHGSRVGTVAKIGGGALVSSLIPFRGAVREVSGAAAADRRLAAAINAGFARRGYLHGLAASRHCPAS